MSQVLDHFLRTTVQGCDLKVVMVNLRYVTFLDAMRSP
jgi:hypothetical protein